ncbi:hypothetical protein [Nonomuraea ceibae]|uniref:hypothetical protein n=1 Tax=Nonomuraea ceibae TaxID=1935170 RepID=UPI001C5DC7D2|nr:hypothetical protein [Nonomuraea ceibae]
MQLGEHVAVAVAVDLGLAGPLTHRGLGQVEVLGHVTDRAVTAPAQFDDLRP